MAQLFVTVCIARYTNDDRQKSKLECISYLFFIPKKAVNLKESMYVK